MLSTNTGSDVIKPEVVKKFDKTMVAFLQGNVIP